MTQLRMTSKQYQQELRALIHWLSCLAMGGEYEELQEQQAYLEWFKSNVIIID